MAPRHLTKRFNGATSAGDLSLHVKEGELLGLLGPNGAGLAGIDFVVLKIDATLFQRETILTRWKQR